MSEPFQNESVRGFLHTPKRASGDGVVLSHGAGSDCTSPLLVRIADALCMAGLLVLRCDLAFRKLRAKGPPFPAMAAADRAGLRDAISAMRQLEVRRVVLGGHSYGGRQSSLLLAEDPQLAEALLLLSYPLHPPRKPDQLRTAHLPQIKTPTLFVHGSRDPFGLPEEMQEAIQLLSGPAIYSELTGAGHDLASGKFNVNEIVVQPLQKLLA